MSLVGMAVVTTLAAGFKPALMSVSLDRTAVAPGGCISAQFTFANLGDRTAEMPLTVFVHPRLIDKAEGTYPMFGADFQPSLPTMYWRSREAVQENCGIRVPANAPEGEYRLLIGFVEPGGRRVPMANDDLATEGLRYEIARFRITRQAQPAQPYQHTFLDASAAKPPAVVTSADMVTIANGDLEAHLDPRVPILYSVRDRRTGETYLGSPRGMIPEVQVCDKRNGWHYLWNFDPSASLTWKIHTGPAEITYTGTFAVGGATAATFDLNWRLDGTGLTAAFANVRESDGFDLMQILLRELCAVGARDKGHLVIPTDGGRDVAAGDSSPQSCELGLNWFDVLQAAVLYREHGHTAIVAKPSGYEDRIMARIASPCAEIGQYASLGVCLVHRLQATPPAAQFVAQPTSGMRLTFIGDLDKDGGADWVDAAKYLRRTDTGHPNPLYTDGTVYKIFCDSPPAHHSPTTFADALALIRRVHNLTAGMPQVVYLVGWQHDGHDTGYPDVSVVNARLGGYDGLMQLMTAAQPLHAIVSFHDNYDDAYKDSPAWDPDIIARDNRGELMKGGVWAGGQSYTISPLRYVQSHGIQRIDSTVARYHIHGSYHIDVLSAVPDRHDFNAKSPAGARETLEGKLKIVQEFNRLGVDVTSEGLTEPFLGHITRFWHLMRRDVTHFTGERRIPFVGFVVHGHAMYGGGQGGAGGWPESLLNGQTYSADFTKSTPEAQILDLIYLFDVPMRAIGNREMQRYSRTGDTERVTYDAGTWVEANPRQQTYRVVVDGVTIADNWTTTVAVKPDVMLVYSRDGGEIKVTLPPTLAAHGADILVRPLTADGPGAAIKGEVRDGVLVLQTVAHRPYRVSVD